jgi:hypothetical protein
MAETTNLYSVSIPLLRSICGGCDTTLVASASASLASMRPLPTDDRIGPRIYVTWKSEIFLNEKSISKVELVEELMQPKWRGTMLYTKCEDPPTGSELQGEFDEISSFSDFIRNELFVKHSTSMKGHFCGISSGSRADWLEDVRKAAAVLAEHIPHEEFVTDLLNGKRRYRHRGRDYAYALQSICHCCGTSHGELGTDRLRSLEIKTPLIKVGSPVRLPKIEDNPAISYLEKEKLEQECNRLKKFKFSEDPSVFSMQNKYQSIVKYAMENEQGLVSFYY